MCEECWKARWRQRRDPNQHRMRDWIDATCLMNEDLLQMKVLKGMGGHQYDDSFWWCATTCLAFQGLGTCGGVWNGFHGIHVANQHPLHRNQTNLDLSSQEILMFFTTMQLQHFSQNFPYPLKQALQVHLWRQLHRQWLVQVGKARGLWVWNGFHGVHLAFQHLVDHNQTSLDLPFGGFHVSQFYYFLFHDLRWISKRVWVLWRGLKWIPWCSCCPSTAMRS